MRKLVLDYCYINTTLAINVEKVAHQEYRTRALTLQEGWTTRTDHGFAPVLGMGLRIVRTVHMAVDVWRLSAPCRASKCSRALSHCCG